LWLQLALHQRVVAVREMLWQLTDPTSTFAAVDADVAETSTAEERCAQRILSLQLPLQHT
jgi:hypothetical protein